MARAKKQKLSLEELLEKAILKGKDIPYEIPGNWVWTELGYISKWGSGGTPSRKNLEFYSGNIPWIKTGELNNGYIYDTEEKITEEAIKKSSAKLFPINTVAIAMYGATIGKVGIFAVEATTNQACACAIPNNCIQYKYLFYYLQSQKEIFIKKGKGGAQPNISQEIIKRHYFPMPPLPEQQRIVERIESLFEKLDAANAIAQNALDSFESRRTAILHKAFTGELTAKWREKNGVRLEDWEKKELGETSLQIIDGDRGVNYPKKSEFTTQGYCLFLNAKNVTKRGFEFQELNFISQEKDKILRKGKLEKFDLVLTTRGTIGNIAYFDENVPYENMRINSGMVIYRGGNEFYKPFLLWLYKSNYIINQINSIKTGSAQPQLPIKLMRQLKLVIPTIDEQKEIVNIINSLLEKEQHAQELCDFIEKIDLMKKSILTRAFRGELGTNNLAEENAIELLKEVLKEK